VCSQVADPQGPRVGDELAEHALPLGEVPHPGSELVVDPDGDEGAQPPAGGQHPQRSVLRVDQPGRGLHDLAEGAVQVQAGGHVEEGIEQVLHPRLRPRHGGQPFLHLVDELGQPHAGEGGLGSRFSCGVAW
jgi:hypothetical protein